MIQTVRTVYFTGRIPRVELHSRLDLETTENVVDLVAGESHPIARYVRQPAGNFGLVLAPGAEQLLEAPELKWQGAASEAPQGVRLTGVYRGGGWNPLLTRSARGVVARRTPPPEPFRSHLLTARRGDVWWVALPLRWSADLRPWLNGP